MQAICAASVESEDDRENSQKPIMGMINGRNPKSCFWLIFRQRIAEEVVEKESVINPARSGRNQS